MDIDRETTPSGELKNGHTVVGATTSPLTPLSFKGYRGVLVYAPGNADPTPNTAPVWVGRAAVTADSEVGTGGMPLVPGASLFIPVDDPSKLYVISTVADQDIAWFCL